jgi:hypothetical protein
MDCLLLVIGLGLPSELEEFVRMLFTAEAEIDVG